MNVRSTMDLIEACLVHEARVDYGLSRHVFQSSIRKFAKIAKIRNSQSFRSSLLNYR